MSASGADHTHQQPAVKRGLPPTGPQDQDQPNKRQCLSAATSGGGAAGDVEAAADATSPPEVDTVAGASEAGSAQGAVRHVGTRSRTDAFKHARERIQAWLIDAPAESASFIDQGETTHVTITATLTNTSTEDTWTLNDYIDEDEGDGEGEEQPRDRKWVIEPGQTRSISLMVVPDSIIVDEGKSSEIYIQRDEIGVGSHRDVPVVGWIVDGEVEVTNLDIRFGSEEKDFSQGGDMIEAVVRGMNSPSYTIQQIQDVMLDWACEVNEIEELAAHMGDTRGDRPYVHLLHSFRERLFREGQYRATLTVEVANGAQTPWNLLQAFVQTAQDLMENQIIKSTCQAEAVQSAFELAAGESATLEIHIYEDGVTITRQQKEEDAENKNSGIVTFQAEASECMPDDNTPGLLMMVDWLRPLEIRSAKATFGDKLHLTAEPAITDEGVHVDDFIQFIRGIKIE